MVIEASYAGKRGAWWEAPGLTTSNAINNEALKAAGNATTGVYTDGFGFINMGSTFGLPRQGTIVAHLQF